MQPLSKAEIKDIMSEPDIGGARPKWPTVKDKETLLEALENKQPTVELNSGTFKIRYSEGYTYKTNGGEKHSTAFVSPTERDVLVPCGWFDAKLLRKDLNGDHS